MSVISSTSCVGVPRFLYVYLGRSTVTDSRFSDGNRSGYCSNSVGRISSSESVVGSGREMILSGTSLGVVSVSSSPSGGYGTASIPTASSNTSAGWIVALINTPPPILANTPRSSSHGIQLNRVSFGVQPSTHSGNSSGGLSFCRGSRTTCRWYSTRSAVAHRSKNRPTPTPCGSRS